jgi:hypothetical protein
MPGSDMACLLKGGGEEFGAVGGAIVRHHPLDLGAIKKLRVWSPTKNRGASEA